MKTRIKIVEYNSGKKEYHCELLSRMEYGAILICAIIIISCLYYGITTTSVEIKLALWLIGLVFTGELLREIPRYAIMKKERDMHYRHISSRDPAVFETKDEAMIFLNEAHEYNRVKLQKEFDGKIKKTKTVKHP